MNDNLQHMKLPIQKISFGVMPTKIDAYAERIACRERGIQFHAHDKAWGYFDGNVIRVVYFPKQIVQDYRVPTGIWTDFLRRVA